MGSTHKSTTPGNAMSGACRSYSSSRILACLRAAVVSCPEAFRRMGNLHEAGTGQTDYNPPSQEINMSHEDVAANSAFPLAPGATPGLTKRELLAGLILQGLLSNSQVKFNPGPAGLAQKAVEQADELLTALYAQIPRAT